MNQSMTARTALLVQGSDLSAKVRESSAHVFALAHLPSKKLLLRFLHILQDQHSGNP